jgi:ADP-heptose:LPS heptosyltransferase
MSPSDSSSPPQAAKRILAVSIGGLGDTILFSPVLKALRSSYPLAHIELLVASQLARIAFTPAKEIDRIFVANTDYAFLLAKAATLLPFSLRSRLSGGFDVGVFATGLNPNFISLLRTLARIRRVYCAPKPPEYETDLSCNISLARRFEPATDEGDIFFPMSGEAFEESRDHLTRHGIPWDGCNIIAVYPSRDLQHRPRWPLRKMVEVIRLLKQRGFKGKIVVVGSLEERKEWEASDSENVVDANLAGRLSISAVGALLSRCKLVLGNDGGIMHVAGAVGCPLVILMTATPASYRPAGKDVRLIRPRSDSCVSHFSRLVKQDPAVRCAEGIEVENVLQECLDQLALM